MPVLDGILIGSFLIGEGFLILFKKAAVFLFTGQYGSSDFSSDGGIITITRSKTKVISERIFQFFGVSFLRLRGFVCGLVRCLTVVLWFCSLSEPFCF